MQEQLAALARLELAEALHALVLDLVVDRVGDGIAVKRGQLLELVVGADDAGQRPDRDAFGDSDEPPAFVRGHDDQPFRPAGSKGMSGRATSCSQA